MRTMAMAMAAILALGGGCEREPTPVPRTPVKDEASTPTLEAALARGVRWLIAQQGNDGTWLDPAEKKSIGLTAFCSVVLARAGRRGTAGTAEPVRRACAFLATYVRDGALRTDEKWFYTGYEVPLVMLALWEADREQHREAIEVLGKHLRDSQVSGSDKEWRRPWHAGGWDYSATARISTDLSVVAFTLEALAEVKPDGWRECVEKALAFVRRCQNRKAISDMANAMDDGGFKHEPRAGKAGAIELANGEYAFISYGSVTCDGIRCYLYGGLGAEDGGVKAAVDWLKAAYTVDENPNVAATNRESATYRRTCYYYYLYSMAKVVRLLGRRVAEDVVRKVLSLQRSDGSWRNDMPMMWEEHAPLATCLMLDALLAAGKAR